jgi:hypothetical protein
VSGKTNLVCAKCGAPMVLRVAKSTGREFLGCSAFPKCWGRKGIAPSEVVPVSAVVESVEATPEQVAAVDAAPMRTTLEFRGVHAEFLADMTPEIDLEGALSCGKTIVCLWKILEALRRYPGIAVLIARWTDDATHALLRPEFEKLARIHGSTHTWNEKFKYYTMGNDSKCFAFGLKTISSEPEQRYGKIRGLPVSMIYIDQAEQLPGDIATELRSRLRPDIEARQRGQDYPRQLIFSPNPTNFDHWLAKQFPPKNNIKGRKYYALSLFDNAHNLPADFIERTEITYPPEHPKHQTMVLGQRGLNVIGDAIYDNLFDRKIHVQPMEWQPETPLIEAFELGKHNPVWVIAQRTSQGALKLLGGILGERLMLEDFIPVVRAYRAEWFPEYPGRKLVVKTCTSPMGEHEQTGTQDRYTLISLLREAKFRPMWRDAANSHDVQLGMIEHVGALLRRRISAREEAIGINADPSRWLSAAPDGTVKERPFMAFAFEGGYVWDANAVSVSNKELRQPHVDDEYSSAMRAVENLVLNFCAGQVSDEERMQARRTAKEKAGLTQGPPLGGIAPWMV